jgi:hypothetical protein
MRRRAHDCLSFEPEATTRGHLGDRTEAPPRMSIAVPVPVIVFVWVLSVGLLLRVTVVEVLVR